MALGANSIEAPGSQEIKKEYKEKKLACTYLLLYNNLLQCEKFLLEIKGDYS